MCIRGTFRQLPSTFRASVGTPINFCQISAHLRVLSSTVCAEAGPSVNIRQLSVCPPDLRSTFRAASGHSVNFRQLFVRQWDLPSNFCVSTEPSINICQLFVCPWDLPNSSVRPLDRLSTSFNFPCGRGIFHQLSVQSWDHPSAFRTSVVPSVNFPYLRGTFRQVRQLFVRLRNYTSILRASAECSVNFRQLSVHPRDLSSTFRFELPSSFHVSAGHSVNFHDIFACPWNLP